MTPEELAAELKRRAAAGGRPAASVPPARNGWTPQAVGAYILAPLIALATSLALRQPAPPPDAPTRAEVQQLQQRLGAAEAEVLTARSACAAALDNAVTARSRAAGAEAVADSAAAAKPSR